MSWGTDTHAGPRRFRVEEVLGAFLMAAMVAVLFIQVVSRFALGSSLSWSEELARYLFIWLIFLCLGAVTVRGEHIAIDILTERLPAGAQRVLAQICLSLAVAINCALLAKGFQIAYVIADVGQTSAALSLPMWIVYAALPVGMVLTAARGVQASIALWRRAADDPGPHPAPTGATDS